jgi:hypothetical protein
MAIRHLLAAGAGLAMAALLPGWQAGAHAGGDVQRAIRQSIAAYSGSCPCPYSTDRAGRRCGARSAHSRGGGAAPICFASDVRGQRRR